MKPLGNGHGMKMLALLDVVAGISWGLSRESCPRYSRYSGVYHIRSRLERYSCYSGDFYSLLTFLHCSQFWDYSKTLDTRP